MSADYDVAVIGAGAAGLAAGLALQSEGRRFVVIEARNRIGGRAYTDTEGLPGIAFDHGGHWLHAAANNPFTAIADRLGFRYSAQMAWSHRVLLTGDGRTADAAMLAESGKALDSLLEAVHAAGEAGRDVAFTEVIDRTDPWYRLSLRTLTQVTSHEPEDCSTLDYVSYRGEGGDFPVERGYGALVAAHAAGLPVSLDTAATRIDWSGNGVVIETPRGAIRARTAIVALPVSVLAAGGLFHPHLPPELEAAIAGCPMGHAEKIAILLDRPIDGFGHIYGDIITGPPLASDPFNLHINPFGRPLVVSHLGGNYSRDLERAGHDAMMDLARQQLVHAFGSSITRRIVRGVTTHWSSDPWTRGAYSHAKAGHAKTRAGFRSIVGNRIVFAGEHCSPDSWSTVHGAHLSGIAAAQSAISLTRADAA